MEEKHSNECVSLKYKTQKLLVQTVQMRNPRVRKFKELAQNHRLWKYEFKFSCMYYQGTDIPYMPA